MTTETTYAGTREFAQLCMEQGHHLEFHVWTFWNGGWSCGGGCCNDDGLDIEDSMEALDGFCEGRYEKVIVCPK